MCACYREEHFTCPAWRDADGLRDGSLRTPPRAWGSHVAQNPQGLHPSNAHWEWTWPSVSSREGVKGSERTLGLLRSPWGWALNGGKALSLGTSKWEQVVGSPTAHCWGSYRCLELPWDAPHGIPQLPHNDNTYYLYQTSLLPGECCVFPTLIQ